MVLANTQYLPWFQQTHGIYRGFSKHTVFYAKTNIHTYIHTNKLTTRQVGFRTTSKLEFHVCLPMQAVELYNQHGKSTIFSKFRNFKFHGQGHVFRRKRQKNVKNEFFDVAYVCMFVNFAHAGRGNRPIHTYLHGPMPILNRPF